MNEDFMISNFIVAISAVVPMFTLMSIGAFVKYNKWVRKNKKLYNTNWKLTKYNNKSYDRYFSKFIIESETGERHIKVATVVLYYTQIVSLIISLVFVIKYPIFIGQGRVVGRKKKEKNGDISL